MITASRRDRFFEIRANAGAAARCVFAGRFGRVPFFVRGLLRAVTP